MRVVFLPARPSAGRGIGPLGASAVVVFGFVIVGTAAAAAGSGWLVQRTPSPKGGAGLAGVSCPSAKVCFAVGSRGEARFFGGHGFRTLAERWNGREWSIQATPDPKRGGASLSGVSCTSATACTAVGQQSQDNGRPLVERWNGRKWSIQPTPETKGNLSAVSCTSATACTAVGQRYQDHGSPLAERWNGRRWSIQPTPNPTKGGPLPPPHAASLSGVSCTSARACTAVGDLYTEQAFVERWNGREWSIQPAPNPTNAGVRLSGVSCTSASLCTAVGWEILPPPCGYSGCYSPYKTLAEQWNGRTWSIQPTPSPTGSSLLSGVSCTSTKACTAIGGSPRALAEYWNGLKWSIQPTPRLNNAVLGAVSCTPSGCTAAGTRNTTPKKTLVERQAVSGLAGEEVL